MPREQTSGQIAGKPGTDPSPAGPPDPAAAQRLGELAGDDLEAILAAVFDTGEEHDPDAFHDAAPPRMQAVRPPHRAAGLDALLAITAPAGAPVAQPEPSPPPTPPKITTDGAPDGLDDLGALLLDEDPEEDGADPFAAAPPAAAAAIDPETRALLDDLLRDDPPAPPPPPPPPRAQPQALPPDPPAPPPPAPRRDAPAFPDSETRALLEALLGGPLQPAPQPAGPDLPGRADLAEPALDGDDPDAGLDFVDDLAGDLLGEDDPDDDIFAPPPRRDPGTEPAQGGPAPDSIAPPDAPGSDRPALDAMERVLGQDLLADLLDDHTGDPPPRPAAEPAARRASPRRNAGMDDLDRVLQVGAARPTAAAKWRVRLVWAVILGALVWVSLQPYPFEVGGEFVVQPLDRAEARARTDGEITAILVAEGDLVAKDQILAVLSNWDEERDVTLTEADGDRLRADLATMMEGARPEQIAVAEEALATAAVQVDIATRELARQEALFAAGTVPEKLVDEARDALDLALAARDQAQAGLDLVRSEARQTEIDAQLAAIARNDEEVAFARLMLEYTNIRAPAAGQIVSDLSGVPVGAYLSTGALFAEIEDTSSVIAEIELPEITIAEIEVGAEAELRLWSTPDESIFGTVRSIAPRAEERDFGRIIRVQVEVPNPDGRLAANMTGFGKISAGELPVWQVFSRAILRFFTIELWSWLP